MELTTDAEQGALTLAMSKHWSAGPSMGRNRHAGVWSYRELQLNFSKTICTIHCIYEQQQNFSTKCFGPDELWRLETEYFHLFLFKIVLASMYTHCSARDSDNRTWEVTFHCLRSSTLKEQALTGICYPFFFSVISNSNSLLPNTRCITKTSTLYMSTLYTQNPPNPITESTSLEKTFKIIKAPLQIATESDRQLLQTQENLLVYVQQMSHRVSGS